MVFVAGDAAGDGRRDQRARNERGDESRAPASPPRGQRDPVNPSQSNLEGRLSGRGGTGGSMPTIGGRRIGNHRRRRERRAASLADQGRDAPAGDRRRPLAPRAPRGSPDRSGASPSTPGRSSTQNSSVPSDRSPTRSPDRDDPLDDLVPRATRMFDDDDRSPPVGALRDHDHPVTGEQRRRHGRPSIATRAGRCRRKVHPATARSDASPIHAEGVLRPRR